MAIFVIIAWNVTEQVWLAFGSDPEVSAMAGYYSRVLSFAIPGILVFGQMSQFFSAQRIMNPEVNSASIGLLMNLVFGLIFVNGWPIPGVSTLQYGTVQCVVPMQRSCSGFSFNFLYSSSSTLPTYLPTYLL
jgi:Na+-driven multidrug efflux pump